MADLKSQVLELIKAKGLEVRTEAFQLSSGESSHHYIDGKKAMANGADLKLVSRAVIEMCTERDLRFEAVGGLTMGADPLAHAISLLQGCDWFSVRKAAKGHGTKSLIEGADLSPGQPVLLVDDIITTGGSILQALDAIDDAGAEVVLAVCLVDRGKAAADRFLERGVAYAPILSYEDLDIPPVGSV